MTSFVFTLIYSIFPGSKCEHTNRLFISVKFRSFLLKGKTIRLSEFLQKYTDSGTETTLLAGYNILVLKYVKLSAGLPLLFIGAIRMADIRPVSGEFATTTDSPPKNSPPLRLCGLTVKLRRALRGTGVVA